jgi:Sec-independent protein translocase protein TatA
MADSTSDSSLPANPPRERPMKGQEVSLGCGTLILIAVIVMLFSGRGTGDLEREVKALRSQVDEIKQAVDRQTSEIKLLRERMENQGGREAEKPSN